MSRHLTPGDRIFFAATSSSRDWDAKWHGLVGAAERHDAAAGTEEGVDSVIALADDDINGEDPEHIDAMTRDLERRTAEIRREAPPSTGRANPE